MRCLKLYHDAVHGLVARNRGVNDDPERTILFANQHWRYRALHAVDLAWQMVSDLFLVNGVRTLLAWRIETSAMHIARSTWITGLLWMIIVVALFHYSSALSILTTSLWFGPVLTLTNLLQKIPSFAEHGNTVELDSGHRKSNSWRPGLFGRLTIWPYNISHHHEHRSSPEVPWHLLPTVTKPNQTTLPGRRLLPLLLNSK